MLRYLQPLRYNSGAVQYLPSFGHSWGKLSDQFSFCCRLLKHTAQQALKKTVDDWGTISGTYAMTPEPSKAQKQQVMTSYGIQPFTETQ